MPDHSLPGPIYSGAFPLLRRRGRNKYLPLTEDDQRLLPRLRPAYQQVLQAAGTMDEIALQLDLPVGTVKSRLHRGRRALAHLLVSDEAQNQS